MLLAMYFSSFYLAINSIVRIFQAGGSTTSSWLVKSMRVATGAKLLTKTPTARHLVHLLVFFGVYPSHGLSARDKRFSEVLALH